MAYLVKPFQKKDLLPAIEMAVEPLLRARHARARGRRPHRPARGPQARRPRQGAAADRARHERAGGVPLPAAPVDGHAPLDARGGAGRPRRRRRVPADGRPDADASRLRSPVRSRSGHDWHRQCGHTRLGHAPERSRAGYGPRIRRSRPRSGGPTNDTRETTDDDALQAPHRSGTVRCSVADARRLRRRRRRRPTPGPRPPPRRESAGGRRRGRRHADHRQPAARRPATWPSSARRSSPASSSPSRRSTRPAASSTRTSPTSRATPATPSRTSPTRPSTACWRRTSTSSSAPPPPASR